MRREMSFDGAPIEELAARMRFSGVVRVDREGEGPYVGAFGEADRRHGIPNTPETRFGIASGTKGFTALAVVSLIADGTLDVTTSARSVLGADLPLIDDGVTIEHLLAHRSGIGDYFNESVLGETNDHILEVPVHRLASTEAYLEVLDGHPTAFPPGERFAYNNGGYVVLALIAERASGVPFAELVRHRVCEPAGMDRTAFLRSDELPGDAAIGYLEREGLRTNALHLPVLGSGDGGIFTTVGDVAKLWNAFLAGGIVPDAWVREMLRPRSHWVEESKRYGLGFHLHETRDLIWLEGSDPGVSFFSTRDPTDGTTATMIANVSDSWEVAILLDDLLGF
jgi:CubicO group peptidase (beta-lactamase class C family)